VKLIIILSMCAALSACDPYKNNLTGNTKVNEVTVYGDVPCAMAVGSSGALALSCDWSRHAAQAVPQ
jgi:hypothetical protein